MLLSKTFRFEASHQIHNHPGKCARLHGHSWVLTISVLAPLNPETGMVMDYSDIKAIGDPIVEALDHHHLGNGFSGVNHWRMADQVESFPLPYGREWIPTSENLLLWIARQLPRDFPWFYLKLNETCTSEAILSREDYEENYAPLEETLSEEASEATAGSQASEGLQKEDLTSPTALFQSMNYCAFCHEFITDEVKATNDGVISPRNYCSQEHKDAFHAGKEFKGDQSSPGNIGAQSGSEANAETNTEETEVSPRTEGDEDTFLKERWGL